MPRAHTIVVLRPPWVLWIIVFLLAAECYGYCVPFAVGAQSHAPARFVGSAIEFSLVYSHFMCVSFTFICAFVIPSDGSLELSKLERCPRL